MQFGHNTIRSSQENTGPMKSSIESSITVGNIQTPDPVYNQYQQKGRHNHLASNPIQEESREEESFSKREYSALSPIDQKHN